MSVADVLNILLYNFPHSHFQKQYRGNVSYAMGQSTFWYSYRLLYPEYKAARLYFGTFKSMSRPTVVPYYRSIPISYV